MLVQPAGAVRSLTASPYTQYVRARAADAAGMNEMAAVHYGAALAASPGDVVLATRAYRQAVIAGDEGLALRAAQGLDAGGALPPDGRILLLVERVKAKNWKAADESLARIEAEQAFAFLAPVARAWIRFGSGAGDALDSLAGNVKGGLSGAYMAEHRALMLLAMGRRSEAVDIIKASNGDGHPRNISLRLVAAETLAAARDRDGALALIQGDEAPFVALRTRIESGKRVAKPVIGPSLGLSLLLIRVAADINRERVTPLAAALARFATFAAPANADAMLVTAQLLASSDRPDAALATLKGIANDHPLAGTARATRVRVLVLQGAKQEALTIMQGVTAASDASAVDWTLLGDIYSGLDRPADAAAAYGRAIEIIGDRKDDDRLRSLWLLRGSALDQCGNWPEARNALEHALALAPDEAVVLNYLGYALLERREDIPRARTLIERASALRPDDAAITDSLGWAYYLDGDLPKAVAKLEVAAAAEPGGSEINEHLGDAYWATGRRVEARYAWRAARVTADDKSTARLDQKIEHGLEASVSAP